MMKIHRSSIAERRITGFTLVELLGMIAIICILCALFMPLLHKSLATARRVSCSNNMKQQFMVMSVYADTNNGMLFSSALSREYFLTKGSAYGGEYGAWGPILRTAFPDEWKQWAGAFACPEDSRSYAILTSIFANGNNWASAYSYSAPMLWPAPAGRPDWFNPAGATYTPGHPNHFIHTRVSRIQAPAQTTLFLDGGGGCGASILNMVYTTIPVPPAATYGYPGWRHDFGRNHNFFDGHVGYYPYFGNPRATDIWSVKK